MAKTARRIRISIIIPTQNRAEILLNCLSLLEVQIDKNRDEVIVVDDGSTELQQNIIGNSDMAHKKWLHLIRTNGGGPARARNMAILKSTGRYLLFLNDDSYICPGFINRHLKFHEGNRQNKYGLVGLTKNHPETVDIEAMKWLVGQSGLHFNYLFSDGGEIKQIPWYYLWTCNLSLKRDYLIANKLTFDETFPTAAWEDIEFAYRSRLKKLALFFDSQAVVYHYHQLGFGDLRARFVSHGRGLWHLKDKLPLNFLPFLIKNRFGEIILWLMSWRLTGAISWIVEKIIIWCNLYPNLLMQFLVIKWKSNGYYIEKNKMSSL